MSISYDDRDFLEDVQQELIRARAKFPNPHFSMTALTEEVGELARALLKVKAGKESPVTVWEEAVQVAAMALRVAVEGDLSIRTYPDEYQEP